jgi:hypothetical protein
MSTRITGRQSAVRIPSKIPGVRVIKPSPASADLGIADFEAVDFGSVETQ